MPTLILHLSGFIWVGASDPVKSKAILDELVLAEDDPEDLIICQVGMIPDNSYDTGVFWVVSWLHISTI